MELEVLMEEFLGFARAVEVNPVLTEFLESLKGGEAAVDEDTLGFFFMNDAFKDEDSVGFGFWDMEFGGELEEVLFEWVVGEVEDGFNFAGFGIFTDECFFCTCS